MTVMRLTLVVLALAAPALGQPAASNGAAPPPAAAEAAAKAASIAATYSPALADVEATTTSELRPLVERYTADRAAIGRRWALEFSPERVAVARAFTAAWQARLREVPFDTLGLQGRIDHVLLANRLAADARAIDRAAAQFAEVESLLPFARVIVELNDGRRRLEAADPAAAAATLVRLTGDVEAVRKRVERGLAPAPAAGDARGAAAAVGDARGAAAAPEPLKPSKVAALRATETLAVLIRTLDQWAKFGSGYDPAFTWWTEVPARDADKALKAYEKLLREKVIGAVEGAPEPIVGNPIGRQALIDDLASEMIAYTPEELVRIAEREFAWCEAEMKKAARDMGFGDDWKAALEKVKTLHVAPGKQPDLIRDFAREAIEFVTARDLVTVPALARDIWRVEMMTPERQRVSPFFLGGEVIQVSFPTDTMDHDDKLMSLRGNNIHFSRATVQHELIPGHHLQGFMTERYAAHRRAFATPFWGEGWALYWEFLLWDLGFPRSAEDRVGMLFWRAHRAARILFSLGFHLGTLTPQQCIDLLVDRVGHERANAEAEVRRSFNGTYSPLYQVAYMIGGLQFQALHREFVQAGRLSNRDFHDTILKNGRIPVEMVRRVLTGEPPAATFTPAWRFAGSF